MLTSVSASVVPGCEVHTKLMVGSCPPQLYIHYITGACLSPIIKHYQMAMSVLG